MILLMVDLRMVEILGVDVILDMDELTAIGLSVIVTLTGLSYPTEVEAFREMMGNSSLGSWVRVGKMCRDRESGSQ